MLHKVLALAALTAAVNGGLYRGLVNAPTVSSQSIIHHDEYASLGHFAAPAHYAAPLAHASPLAYYAAPAPYAAHYENEDESDKDFSNDK